MIARIVRRNIIDKSSFCSSWTFLHQWTCSRKKNKSCWRNYSLKLHT